VGCESLHRGCGEGKLMYPVRNSKKLVAGSHWRHSRARKRTVTVISLTGTWVRYQRDNGQFNECTAWGFLNVYRPMEADQQ
jgi:hypothetical protein